VVLADEINRATPRTQSALLESMAEKQITVEGISRRLSDPFIVMATQNPIEYDGTFPLPEAQLDRFLIRLEIGYPESVDEEQILKNLQLQHPVEKLEAVMTDQEFIDLQDDVKKVHVDQKLRKYIVSLVNQSRSHSDLELGASPRGSITLMKMAQAWAVVNERDYIIPDDIKEIAPAVLAHRLIIKSKSRLRGADKEKIIKEILRRTEVPVID
jgi:MoxR-like ATPase